MSNNDLLRNLNIDVDGMYQKDGCYTADISDSDKFAQIQSRLDKSNSIEFDDDLSYVKETMIYAVYEGADYTITLIGDLDNDTYRLIVKDFRNERNYNR